MDLLEILTNQFLFEIQNFRLTISEREYTRRSSVMRRINFSDFERQACSDKPLEKIPYLEDLKY